MTRPTSPPRSLAACLGLGVLGAGWLFAAAGAGAADAADTYAYTVQPGDHPWRIASQYLQSPGQALRLARLNGIRNDRQIAPGTVLKIPLAWLRLQPARVRLAVLQGEVLLVGADGSTQPASAGMDWPAGMALRTGAQSSVQLEFGDGSQALVRQGTQVRLLQSQRPVLGDGQQMQLELVRGAVENMVRPVSRPGARFEIRTPAAVAAVRGTQFRVSATDTQTRTEVLEGQVLVRNSAGESAAAAGTGSIADQGMAPGAAQRLLDPPDASAVPARLERLPVDWPLPAVPGGVSYRTQVATSERFDALVSDEVTSAPRLRISNLPDGPFVVRVRAIDARGLEGVSAQRPLELAAQPAPPFLIEPAPDAQTQAPRPTFRWTQTQGVARYRLQVLPAQGADSAPPVLDQEVAAGSTVAAAADLPPGLYRWRVAAIDASRNRQGPWGDSQALRRVEPGPQSEPPRLQDGALNLGWSAQTHAQRYRLQLSQDPAFGSLLADTELASPGYRVNAPAPGTYHARVQTIATDGFAGPWGATQSFTVPAPEPAPPPQRSWWLLLPLLLILLP